MKRLLFLLTLFLPIVMQAQELQVPRVLVQEQQGARELQVPLVLVQEQQEARELQEQQELLEARELQQLHLVLVAFLALRVG